MSRMTIAASVLALAVSTAAFATPDGTIKLTGKIVGTTCTINNAVAGSAIINVGLPSVLASALNSEGRTAGKTSFAIKLTRCDPSVNKVAVSFVSGGSNINRDGTLANTGTAKQVSVALLNSSGTQINLATGDNNNGPVTLDDGGGSLAYSAQYNATGTVTSGTVASSVTFNLVYF